MLIELLSSSNYVNFNVTLAQIVGLESAIHISQLLDINEKAVRKGKVTDGFFVVDRKYITQRTTLTKDKQVSIEANLEKVGVLKRSTTMKNGVQLDLTMLTSILMSPDEDLVKEISSVTKSRDAKAKAKSAAIEENLKDNIITNNPELREAYEQWIESVLTKEGWMTKAAVQVAQSTIDRFSNRNLDVALKILEIAAVNAYRDVTWAINAYNKDVASNHTASRNDYSIPARAEASPCNIVRRPRTSEEVF